MKRKPDLRELILAGEELVRGKFSLSEGHEKFQRWRNLCCDWFDDQRQSFERIVESPASIGDGIQYLGGFQKDEPAQEEESEEEPADN